MYRLLLLLVAASFCPGQKIAAPRIWNDQAPGRLGRARRRPQPSSRPLFRAGGTKPAPRGEWVRTYPAYFPGREPAGYWEMLRNKKPEPIITPGAQTAEWIAAGRQVFRELDVPPFRSYDPKHFAILRSAERFQKTGGHARKDGTVAGLRLVPTGKGLALSMQRMQRLPHPHHARRIRIGRCASQRSRRWPAGRN